MSGLALGFALHFDAEIAAEPASYVELIGWLAHELDAATLVSWRIPCDPTKRATPTRALDLDALTQEIREGDSARATIATAPPATDEDRMIVGVDVASRAQRKFSQTVARYGAYGAFGGHVAHALDAEHLVARIVAFADAVSVGAGAVYWTASVRHATALVTAGGNLSPDEVKWINAVHFEQPLWPDVIRGPAWGTFLSAAHVATLGGIKRIEHESGAARVIALPKSGGAYVQATSIHEPIVEGPQHRYGALSRLAAFFAPVIAPASPRHQ